MKVYKHKNATINIQGEISRERLEEATIKFMKKVYKFKHRKARGINQNGNKDTTRAV